MMQWHFANGYRARKAKSIVCQRMRNGARQWEIQNILGGAHGHRRAERETTLKLLGWIILNTRRQWAALRRINQDFMIWVGTCGNGVKTSIQQIQEPACCAVRRGLEVIQTTCRPRGAFPASPTTSVVASVFGVFWRKNN